MENPAPGEWYSEFILEGTVKLLYKSSYYLGICTIRVCLPIPSSFVW